MRRMSAKKEKKGEERGGWRIRKKTRERRKGEGKNRVGQEGGGGGRARKGVDDWKKRK